MTKLKPYFIEMLKIYCNYPGIKKNRMVSFIAMRMIKESQPDDYTYMDVNWIAGVLKVKVSLLSKRYQKEFYYTIQHTIIKQKVWWAVRFLVESPEMSIEEIASKLDYCNGNYFIKVFKKEKAISPLQFRIRYRNSPPEVKEEIEVTDEVKQSVKSFLKLYDCSMYLRKLLRLEAISMLSRQKRS